MSRPRTRPRVALSTALRAALRGCLLLMRLPKTSALTWKKETVARGVGVGVGVVVVCVCVWYFALWQTREPDWRTLTSIGSLKLFFFSYPRSWRAERHRVE